jgi:hypothetical protein
MLPNPYFLDEMARTREEETQRLLKHAWHRRAAGGLADHRRARRVLVVFALLTAAALRLLG